MSCDSSTNVFDPTKVEKYHLEVWQGVPVFWLTATSYLVLPALTCTSHGYKAFTWEFPEILVTFAFLSRSRSLAGAVHVAVLQYSVKNSSVRIAMLSANAP